MEENIVENKKQPRYIFLTTILGISCLIAGLGILLSTIKLLTVFFDVVSKDSLIIGAHGLVTSVFQLCFSIALIKWKKWGLWGFTILSALNCIYYYSMGWGAKIPFNLIFLGLIYLSLFIGKDKAWNKLEK